MQQVIQLVTMASGGQITDAKSNDMLVATPTKPLVVDFRCKKIEHLLETEKLSEHAAEAVESIKVKGATRD